MLDVTTFALKPSNRIQRLKSQSTQVSVPLWTLPRWCFSRRLFRSLLGFCVYVARRGRLWSWTALGKRVRTWSGSTTSASTAGLPTSSWRGTAAVTRAPRASGSTSAACRRPLRRRTSPSTVWSLWAPTRTSPRADGPDGLNWTQKH